MLIIDTILLILFLGDTLLLIMLRTQFDNVIPIPPSKTYHIIWNLLLADKQLELTPDVITNEKIAHIFAILPSTAEFMRLNTDIPDCPFTVLEYGDIHEPVVDKELFNKCGRMIDGLARKPVRENILVFCNNGYQRSIPFLAHYLTEFHRDDVKDVEKAIQIILSQVDKPNYNNLVAPMTESVSQILSSS